MKRVLENIVATKEYWLETVVAKLLLTYEHVDYRFKKLLDGRCYSWAIPELISLDFTHQIFDEHYEEIEYIRKLKAYLCYEDQLYPQVDIKHDFVQTAIDYIVENISEDSLELKKDSRI